VAPAAFRLVIANPEEHPVKAKAASIAIVLCLWTQASLAGASITLEAKPAKLSQYAPGYVVVSVAAPADLQGPATL